MKYLLLALLLLPLTTFATDLQISCTATQKYTDGSAVAAGTVMNFNFYGALQGQPKVLLNTSNAPTACAFTWKAAPVGTVCVSATETIAGVGESAQSVDSCSGIPAPPAPKPAAPGAPTLKIVTTAPTAYNVVQGQGVFALLPIGTVPLGTACDPQNTVNGLFAVPRGVVKLTNPNSTSTVIVASCS